MSSLRGRVTSGAAALIALVACRTAPSSHTSVEAWLREHATRFDARAPLSIELEGALAEAIDGARVVGLGEATHGQHEAFELKRALTMQLVRDRGFRVVAYEASSSSVLACDAYVAGTSDDLVAARRGLSMLVWDVEENVALLEDLRAWNRAAEPHERVRFVGIDVQDPTKAGARLAEIVAARSPELATTSRELGARIEPAVQALWSGRHDDFDRVTSDWEALRRSLEALDLGESTFEAELRVEELAGALAMATSAGGRDAAMARMLLAILEHEGSRSRAVLWAHNAHVMRGPLRFLSTDELAMGGPLAAALGDGYYAVGFAFGEGEFQALEALQDGSWAFQRYALGAPPAGTLESAFVAARLGDCIVDVRSAPRAGPVGAWLEGGHLQRWYGGYGIPKDFDDPSKFPITVPRKDFDALVFLARTSAAQPVRRELVRPASRNGP